MCVCEGDGRNICLTTRSITPMPFPALPPFSPLSLLTQEQQEKFCQAVKKWDSSQVEHLLSKGEADVEQIIEVNDMVLYSCLVSHSVVRLDCSCVVR